jgi:hypothetical protein
VAAEVVAAGALVAFSPPSPNVQAANASESQHRESEQGEAADFTSHRQPYDEGTREVRGVGDIGGPHSVRTETLRRRKAALGCV